MLSATFEKQGDNISVTLSPVALADLSSKDLDFVKSVVQQQLASAWLRNPRKKRLPWRLALLTNQREANPPSNEKALKRFVKAGKKLGIDVVQVDAQSIGEISQYDGLFIRETTEIDHHTYRLAELAEKHDVEVIDDATSILRCCNKVFLHDAFSYHKVPSLKTRIISDASPETVMELATDFGYPLVLKMPESSFSRGVFKVSNDDELRAKLTSLLEQSALVLAQEYLKTDYDWRIGVLNGKALYACRYFMAKNHWQIYNHADSKESEGGFDAMGTYEVPKKVLDAVLKSAAIIGKGLYGIDIKEVNGKAYVIEVNDNPNIDHGVEDHFIGDELYMQIMGEFLRRFETRGKGN